MIQYHDLLKHILAKGEHHEDRTGVGTLSVFGYQMRFDLEEGFPLVTTKRVPFRWIAEELFWFLSGDTYEPNLRAKGVDIWKEWADLEHTTRFGRAEGDLGPVYGFLWRHFGGFYDSHKTNRDTGGVDQINALLKQLEKNPGSRRLIVSGWDPYDADRVDLPPCHTLFQFKVHADDTLSCHLYMRSCDSFLGLPFNIASYALLTEMIAHVTGRTARELVISFGDVHIYNNHLTQVGELLSRKPYPPPALQIHDPLHKLRGLPGLLSFNYDDLELVDYMSHGRIEATVAV